MSISGQWLLWSGSRPIQYPLCRHDHVDVNFSYKMTVKTTNHGDVEDMELSGTTQVTGDH